jgi:flagellar hook assembly protein FlgD
MVKTLARGEFTGGQQSVTWDGCGDDGRPVANGLYLLRTQSGGERGRLKVVVMR